MGNVFISSVSSLSFLLLFLPCPSLSSPLLSLLFLFSLSLWDDTKWLIRVDMLLNPNTVNKKKSFFQKENNNKNSFDIVACPESVSMIETVQFTFFATFFLAVCLTRQKPLLLLLLFVIFLIIMRKYFKDHLLLTTYPVWPVFMLIYVFVMRVCVNASKNCSYLQETPWVTHTYVLKDISSAHSNQPIISIHMSTILSDSVISCNLWKLEFKVISWIHFPKTKRPYYEQRNFFSLVY